MSLSTTTRGLCMAIALTLSLALVFAAGASATGPPVNVGTPFSDEQPAVAVDNAGDAVIAWANTRDLAGAKNFVQYCILPVGAVGCANSGNLIPADGAEYIDNVQVLNEGSTLVVLADVFGAQGPSSLEYEPVQEWQSTDGGATFSIVNGGKSVAEGNIGGDTNPLNAVTVPGTGVLGYGWNAAVSAPTFHAFPLASPPECSEAPGGCTSGFATLEPNTNPDQIPNLESHFAAQLGANPGVLGVFFTDFTNGPLGCSNAQTVPFGTAYAYASGDQSPANDYNISPGKPNSAWKVAVTQADCNVEYSTVAGGPSGFGVLEDNELTGQTVYHRFDQATEAFDTPLVTVAQEGEESPAVSQDSAGGVYATFLGNGGPGGPIRLAYSGDGGSTWSVNTLNANGDLSAGDLTSNVNATGQGWATWTDNGSVYAQPFVASDAVAAVTSPPTPTPTSAAAATTLTTFQTAGTTTGASISVPAGTVGETDQAVLSGTNAASATGTVDYALYGNSSCTGAPLFSGASAVTAGKVAASAPVTSVLAPGAYFWKVAYSGDALNSASASACGSEVLTVTPAATIGGEGESTSSTVTLTISCSSPCTVTVTITVPSSSGKASAARKSKKKHANTTVTLGTGTFTLRTAGTKKLTVHLTKVGKRYLASHHGRVSAKVLISQATAGGTVMTTRTIKITPAKHKHKK